MNRKPKIIITGIILIVLFVIGIGIFTTYLRTSQSNVELVFQIPPSKTVSARFNNRLVSPKNSPKPGQTKFNYALRSGHYELDVNVPSYKQFSAEFNLSPQEPTEIIVNLKPTTKPSASDLSKIITQAVGTSSSVALSSQLTPATTITNTQYFDNQTWALVTLNLRGGIGLSYFVDHYNAYYGRWVLVAPPNDNFNANTVGTMPTDLQNYINHNYYVER